MTKFKIISVAVIVLAGVAASVIIQHRYQSRFDQRESLLQKQEEQMTALALEHQRLSNLVARVDRARPERNTELARLSLEAKTLKSQTNNLGQKLGKNDDQSKSNSAQNPETHPPEYYENCSNWPAINHGKHGTLPRHLLPMLGITTINAQQLWIN